MERIGRPRLFFSDTYHFFLTTSWLNVILIYALGFVVTNLCFALAYWNMNGAISGGSGSSFEDAFFFSVQAISTIGFGVLTPNGLAANVLMTVETFVGLLGFALITGLTFAKFSRPTARVLFSKRALVGIHNGEPALMLRLANGRANQIFDAKITVHLLRDETTKEGMQLRRFHELQLVRRRTPVFALTWTAFHIIDAESPLFGMTAEKLIELNGQLIVVINGLDETFVQPIHPRGFYGPEAIAWNGRFVDMVSRDNSGQLCIDYRRFHETISE